MNRKLVSNIIPNVNKEWKICSSSGNFFFCARKLFRIFINKRLQILLFVIIRFLKKKATAKEGNQTARVPKLKHAQEA